MADACIFCRIIKKELPAKVISETGEWLSFRDINPQAPIHIVLVPKKHGAGLSDYDADDRTLLGGVLLEADRIAQNEGLAESGYRLLLNRGIDAGQTVEHLHFHILGGRLMGWPPG